MAQNFELENVAKIHVPGGVEAYSTTLPVIKLEEQGGTGGNPWDHGVYAGVRKVYVTYSPPGISYIKVDYDNAGKVETRENGNLKGENGVEGETYEFLLDYPNEYITAVEGTCDIEAGRTNRIRSLSFKTSTERISPTYGKLGTRSFVFESKGRALVGFHGRAGLAIDAIGVYFGPAPIPIPLPVIKLEKQGGTGGNPWDHGVYTGVRKVYVTYSPPGISYIKVDYDNAGKVETRENGNLKGENGVEGETYEFLLDYPNEYITAVEGTCDIEAGRTNRIRSLSFKTSTERISPTYGKLGTRSFVFESKGRALVGFHGRAGLAIDAIGAYFGPTPIPIPLPVIKLEKQGGTGGNPWDHGVYAGVRKVYVTYSPPGISYIKVDYDNAGKVETRENGNLKGENGVEGETYEFLLDYPNEYITAVEGTCDIEAGRTNRIRSLSFKTSTKRISPTYGKLGTRSFVFESKGRALVGFHGRAGLAIDAIGAYFGPTPIPLPLPVIKMEEQGGTGGNAWDHGVYTGVRKVYVTYSPPGISYIKVDYDNAGKVETRENGNPKGENGVEGETYEFLLDYPNEYITAVEGTCDIEAGLTNRIRSLSFKTSTKRISPTYGKLGTRSFVFESEGRLLVGFHGRAGLAIDSIGVYFGPAPIPLPQASYSGRKTT